MTTAQRREEILALLNQADAPIAAKDLAARFGVSRQVIVQDLAVIRASPAQYHLHQPRLYPAAAGNRLPAGSLRSATPRSRPGRS